MAKVHKDFSMAEFAEFAALSAIFMSMVFLYGLYGVMKKRSMGWAIVGAGLIGGGLYYAWSRPAADSLKKGGAPAKIAVFDSVHPAPRADTMAWPTVARDRIWHMMPTQRVK